MPCLEPGPKDRPVPGSRMGLPASPPKVGLTLALSPSCSPAPDSEALKVQRKKTSKCQNPAGSSCPHLPPSSPCHLLPLGDQVTKTNPAPATRRLLHPFTQGSGPCRSRLLKTTKAAAFTEPGQPASSSTWAGGDSPARQAGWDDAQPASRSLRPGPPHLWRGPAESGGSLGLPFRHPRGWRGPVNTG